MCSQPVRPSDDIAPLSWKPRLSGSAFIEVDIDVAN
jgi:hypothetical protein